MAGGGDADEGHGRPQVLRHDAERRDREPCREERHGREAGARPGPAAAEEERRQPAAEDASEVGGEVDDSSAPAAGPPTLGRLPDSQLDLGYGNAVQSQLCTRSSKRLSSSGLPTTIGPRRSAALLCTSSQPTPKPAKLSRALGAYARCAGARQDVASEAGYA